MSTTSTVATNIPCRCAVIPCRCAVIPCRCAVMSERESFTRALGRNSPHTEEWPEGMYWVCVAHMHVYDEDGELDQWEYTEAQGVSCSYLSRFMHDLFESGLDDVDERDPDEDVEIVLNHVKCKMAHLHEYTIEFTDSAIIDLPVTYRFHFRKVVPSPIVASDAKRKDIIRDEQEHLASWSVTATECGCESYDCHLEVYHPRRNNMMTSLILKGNVLEHYPTAIVLDRRWFGNEPDPHPSFYIDVTDFVPLTVCDLPKLSRLPGPHTQLYDLVTLALPSGDHNKYVQRIYGVNKNTIEELRAWQQARRESLHAHTPENTLGVSVPNGNDTYKMVKNYENPCDGVAHGQICDCGDGMIWDEEWNEYYCEECECEPVEPVEEKRVFARRVENPSDSCDHCGAPSVLRLDDGGGWCGDKSCAFICATCDRTLMWSNEDDEEDGRCYACAEDSESDEESDVPNEYDPLVEESSEEEEDRDWVYWYNDENTLIEARCGN